MASLGEWVAETKNQGIGKWVGSSLYVHRSAVDLRAIPLAAKAAAAKENSEWNVLKVSQKDATVSFLRYLDFDTDPHPILECALTFHIAAGKFRKINYDVEENPPILHRKELLVHPEYPGRLSWEETTRNEEAQGLYRDTKTIGFLRNWRAMLESKGMLGDSVAVESEPVVDRHKTAISRNGLSRPVQVLLQEGLLTKECSLFDYGCGRGDDFSLLRQQGIEASGWDPVHFPKGERKRADVVNLGYVLNVIEDPAERVEVLTNAFELSDKVLSVSVLVENMQTAQSLKPYRDGFLTSKNTFQKYYNQIEFAQYVEDVLQSPQVILGPGHIAVFKSHEAAEEYLIDKSTKKNYAGQFGFRLIWNKSEKDQFKKDVFFRENESVLEAYWGKTLELGRFPFEDEFEDLVRLRDATGSLKRLQSWVVSHYSSESFEKAIQEKREDLIVYLALRHFQKRLPLNALPVRIKNDIRACFSSFNAAWETANRYLFQIGKPETITKRCDESIIGRIDSQALYVKPADVNKLDTVLRIYIHVGGLFYGNINEAHEIKIHKASGKITFLKYEDPASANPKTTIRVKVDLGRQKVEYYDHRE